MKSRNNFKHDIQSACGAVSCSDRVHISLASNSNFRDQGAGLMFFIDVGSRPSAERKSNAYLFDL